MKKRTLRLVSLALVCLLCLGLGACEKGPEISVYNWSEYIDESVLEDFTAETGIRVRYDSTIISNEEMYAKIKNGGSRYDVVFPSDYMVDQMIKEEMLAPLDRSLLTNYDNIDESYLNLYYDPENKYSVPYMAGTVGILYNPEKTGKEITSFAEFFNPQYKKQILMLDSVRDSMMVAASVLGYDMNDTDPKHIKEMYDLLSQQKPMVLAYGADDLREKMIGGEAALATVYSGEGNLAVEEDSKLRFVAVPDEGTNLAIEAMVILKSSENKENATKFIDFMLRPEIAARNAAMGYSTTNRAGKELLPDEVKNNPSKYFTAEALERCDFFRNIPEAIGIYTEYWDKLSAQ